MNRKPTYDELEKRVKELEKESLESKAAEEELSVAYDALNSSVNGVIITNLEGGITYVNPAFLRIFGYTEKAEVLGKNAADLFPGEEVKRFADVKAIIDPIDDKIMAVLKTTEMLMGNDEYCTNYLKGVRAGQIVS